MLFPLTLLHSEWPKLYGGLAILSAIGLKWWKNWRGLTIHLAWLCFHPDLTIQQQDVALTLLGLCFHVKGLHGCFYHTVDTKIWYLWSVFLLFRPVCLGGWSGGAKVLGKLSVPGRPTNLDGGRAGAYCACSGCRYGWGLLGHFSLAYLFSFSSLGDGPV